MPYLPEGMPVPVATELDAPYWEANRRHELTVQRCTTCDAKQFPPEEVCLGCGGDALDWVEVEPRGTLHSWTRTWHMTHPSMQGGGAYVIAIVSLDAGSDLRLWGNLIDEIEGDPPLDEPVEAVFEDHDGYTLVQWRLASR